MKEKIMVIGSILLALVIFSGSTSATTTFVDFIDEDWDDGDGDGWSFYGENYGTHYNITYQTGWAEVSSEESRSGENSLKLGKVADYVKSRRYAVAETYLYMEQETEYMRCSFYFQHYNQPINEIPGIQTGVREQGFTLSIDDYNNDASVFLDYQGKDKNDYNKSLIEYCHSSTFETDTINISLYQNVWNKMVVEMDYTKREYIVSLNNEKIIEEILTPTITGLSDNQIYFAFATYTQGYVGPTYQQDFATITYYDDIYLGLATDYLNYIESKGYVVDTEETTNKISVLSGLMITSGLFLTLVAMFKQYQPQNLDWLIPGAIRTERFSARFVLVLGVMISIVGYLYFKGVFT